jgi:lysophospholipid acyltransferase 7
MSRYVHVVTFVWCFTYLLFFRTTNWFSIQSPAAHSNAIQLMLTLKVRLIDNICMYVLYS